MALFTPSGVPDIHKEKKLELAKADTLKKKKLIQRMTITKRAFLIKYPPSYLKMKRMIPMLPE